MIALKLGLLSAICALIYYVEVCASEGNYTIGFEDYGRSRIKPNPTHSPKPNPTYRPSTTSHRPSSSKPNPTYRPSSSKPNPTYRPSSPKPNPTYRPSSPKPNPTYPKPNPTYRPSSPKPNPTYPKPNPTYRPSSPKPNPGPSKPNATLWQPNTNPVPPKTTPRPATRRTTPKPTPPPKPTSPPLWNIWTSNYVPNQATPSLSTKTTTNNFKNDATLLGLYTLMRNVVGVTSSQTGQSKPAKKPLHETYPYYYAVYHYNKDREKVSSKIFIPFESVVYCDAGTSDRTCVPGTYALCLADWTIMCVTYSTATLPCHFNTSLPCATSRVPCDNRDPVCASMGNQMEVQTPCVSNVLVTSQSAIIGSMVQSTAQDPYAAVVPGPVDLCTTTILEMKKLESPLGAVVGLLTEVGKVHVDFLNNFNSTQNVYIQPGILPPATVRPYP